jgi:hypothetical protein
MVVAMITQKGQSHKHRYTTPVFEEYHADNKKFTGNPFRAFIYWQCECGHKVIHSEGEREERREIFTTLKKLADEKLRERDENAEEH